MQSLITEADVAHWINHTSFRCSHPAADGFYAWGLKQDLYQMKFALDAALLACPKFSPEEEWLREQEQKKIIKILKG